MNIFFKNQLKIVWKKWFSFIGIFILIFLSVLLTSSSLAASKNISNVFDSLNESNMYEYRIGVSNRYFSDKGFNKIHDYFFVGQPALTYDQKKDISTNNSNILSSISAHSDEIKKWNFNFHAWIINGILAEHFPSNKLAVDYQANIIGEINNNTYNLTVMNGFNDSRWVFINSAGNIEAKYNLKTSNLVYLTKGRKPIADNEVVTNISVNNQNNIDFNIGKTISINSKEL